MGIKASDKTISLMPDGAGVILHEIVNPRRIPDSSVNGVILSPARARLLAVTIRRGYAESADELRTFLMALEREQRAEDKTDPEVAAVRRLVWQKTAPKVRPAATPAPRSTKTDADRRREIQEAERTQAALAANVWRPAGAGKARIRQWNLDPARAAALMNAIADTNQANQK